MSEDYTIGESFLQRDRDGKLSEKTIVALPEVEGRRLKLWTYKSNRGLQTHASVHHCRGGMETHALFADFSKTVLHSGARGTETAIRAQHAEARRKIPELIAEIRAHYANTVEGQRADRLREQRAA